VAPATNRDGVTLGDAAGKTSRLREKQCRSKDSLIAATALVHGLVVATRNTSDFAKAGIDVTNPFDFR
jgi:predicted nucleic acid-binding protein